MNVNTHRTLRAASKDAKAAREAWEAGKPIQKHRWAGQDWEPVGPTEKPDFADPNTIWRTVPEPKLRPFTRDEVPPGCVIRLKANHSYWVMLTARLGEKIKCGVMTVAGLPSEFERIESHPEEYELSTDCGATWLPCGVMEESK